MIRTAQRGIDFCCRIKPINCFIGQHQMMRRGFRRDLHTALFGGADDLDRPFAADMSDMNRRPGIFSQQDIARNRDIFGDRRATGNPQHRRNCAFVHITAGHQIGVFGVGDDRAVEHGRIFQAGQKQVAAGHVMPVFRYRHRTGQLHITDLRQFFAFHPLGHRPDHTDPHDAVAAGPFAQTLNQY